jgi:hypothetical protein
MLDQIKTLDPDHALLVVLSDIDRIEDTYWETWNALETAADRAKHIKLMDGVQWCYEQRIKLLGIARAPRARAPATHTELRVHLDAPPAPSPHAGYEL